MYDFTWLECLDSEAKQEQQENQRVLDNAIAHLESIDEVIAELDAEREQVLKLPHESPCESDKLERVKNSDSYMAS